MSSTVRPSAPSKQTVVEEGSCFKGTLTSTCPIHVHGRIEGDLETPSLTVSATGAVHGRAKVGAVRSQGELSGEFDADTIELAGTVRDNTVIRARSLEVKLASTRGKLQVIFGECELAVGDEPTEHDAVEPMTARLEAAAAAAVAVSDDAVAPPLDAPPSELPALVPPPPALPLMQALVMAAAAPNPDEEDDDVEDTAEGDAVEASDAPAEGGRPAKRRRKRRNGDVEVPNKGWSQPPSQPPPAN